VLHRKLWLGFALLCGSAWAQRPDPFGGPFRSSQDLLLNEFWLLQRGALWNREVFEDDHSLD